MNNFIVDRGVTRAIRETMRLKMIREANTAAILVNIRINPIKAIYKSKMT